MVHWRVIKIGGDVAAHTGSVLVDDVYVALLNSATYTSSRTIPIYAATLPPILIT